MAELHWLAACGDLCHVHALAVGGRGEIERDLGDPVADELEVGGCLASDLVGVIPQCEVEDVMNDINAGLPGVDRV